MINFKRVNFSGIQRWAHSGMRSFVTFYPSVADRAGYFAVYRTRANPYTLEPYCDRTTRPRLVSFGRFSNLGSA